MASKTSRKSLKPENPTRASERLRKSSKTPQISDVNGNESTQVKLQPTIKEELNYSPQYSDPFGSHFHSKIPITQRPQLLWNSKAFKSKSYYQCQNFSYFSKFSDHLCHVSSRFWVIYFNFYWICILAQLESSGWLVFRVFQSGKDRQSIWSPNYSTWVASKLQSEHCGLSLQKWRYVFAIDGSIDW